MAKATATETAAPAADAAPAAVADIPGAPVTSAAADASATVEARPADGTAKKQYRVSYADVSGIVEATDENEAWALFCDAHKKWPSPRHRTVELLPS